jgi:hypothetical protein
VTGSVWSHSSDVAYVEEEDRVVLVDLTRPADPPQIFNGSAATIWLAVDGQRDEDAVVAHVAQAYGVEGVEVAVEVRTFLGELDARGLLSPL